MGINRIIWKYTFTVERLPEWICPTCKKGNLTGNKSNFIIHEDSASKTMLKERDWEASWITGVFTGMIQCNNSKCMEFVAVIGDMSVEEEHVYDDKYDDVEYVAYEVLKPKIFIPPLQIFDLNDNLPPSINMYIREAFSLYHVDTSACANKIRIVVELLMDFYKIKKTIITSRRKRKRVTLHERIELFKEKFSSEGELLMAIKWIGNIGSHSIEPLTQDDILDGFEMLEHVLNKLFEMESKRIKSLGKTINKRKGPVKR
ncbi:DUF4145 domain-containing protein [Flavobacterium sp. DGU11]|uniref:DUF4145 domain-containing protein n=1 Tax=Flavobacterium arundinis TaxID=3139143 RepID=A0ABU9HU49_9FLAO